MLEISPCPEIWVKEFDHWHDWVMTEQGPPSQGLEFGGFAWTRLYHESLDPDRGLRCDKAIARTGPVMSVILRERHLWQKGDTLVYKALGLSEMEYEILTREAYERFATHYQVMLDARRIIRYHRRQIIRSCL